MDTPSPDTSAVQTRAAPSRWSRWVWPALAVLVLFVCSLAGGLYAALASEAGSRWLLGLVPGLQSSGVRGCLLDDFDADQLRYRLNDRQVLQIDQLRWRGVQLRWPDGKAPMLGLAQLSIGHLDLQGSASSDAPPVLPAALNLPIAVQIGKVRIDRLSVDALRERPVRDLSAALSLQAGREDTARLLREGGALLNDLLRQAGYRSEAVTVTILPGSPQGDGSANPGSQQGQGAQGFPAQGESGANQGRATPDQSGRRAPDESGAASHDSRERMHESVSSSPDRSGVYL